MMDKLQVIVDCYLIVSEVGECDVSLSLLVVFMLFVDVQKFVIEVFFFLGMLKMLFLVKIFRVNLYRVFGVKCLKLKMLELGEI